jgi:hypothetical protein
MSNMIMERKSLLVMQDEDTISIWTPPEDELEDPTDAAEFAADFDAVLSVYGLMGRRTGYRYDYLPDGAEILVIESYR